jgi:hypothetical protein
MTSARMTTAGVLWRCVACRGNLVYKIIECEGQRQRDRLVWLPPGS